MIEVDTTKGRLKRKLRKSNEMVHTVNAKGDCYKMPVWYRRKHYRVELMCESEAPSNLQGQESVTIVDLVYMRLAGT